MRSEHRRYTLRWVGAKGGRGWPADAVVLFDEKTGMQRYLTQGHMTRNQGGYDERVSALPGYVHEEFWEHIARARDRNWR